MYIVCLYLYFLIHVYILMWMYGIANEIDDGKLASISPLLLAAVDENHVNIETLRETPDIQPSFTFFFPPHWLPSVLSSALMCVILFNISSEVLDNSPFLVWFSLFRFANLISYHCPWVYYKRALNIFFFLVSSIHLFHHHLLWNVHSAGHRICAASMVLPHHTAHLHLWAEIHTSCSSILPSFSPLGLWTFLSIILFFDENKRSVYGES